MDIALTWSSPPLFLQWNLWGAAAPPLLPLSWNVAQRPVHFPLWSGVLLEYPHALVLCAYPGMSLSCTRVFVSLKERSLEAPGHPQVRADWDVVSLLQSQAPVSSLPLSHDTEPPPLGMVELTLTFPFFYRSAMGLFRPQAGHLWCPVSATGLERESKCHEGVGRTRGYRAGVRSTFRRKHWKKCLLSGSHPLRRNISGAKGQCYFSHL